MYRTIWYLVVSFKKVELEKWHKQLEDLEVKGLTQKLIQETDFIKEHVYIYIYIYVLIYIIYYYIYIYI